MQVLETGVLTLLQIIFLPKRELDQSSATVVACGAEGWVHMWNVYGGGLIGKSCGVCNYVKSTIMMVGVGGGGGGGGAHWLYIGGGTRGAGGPRPPPPPPPPDFHTRN